MSSSKLWHILSRDIGADYYETVGNNFTASSAATGFGAALAGNRTRSNYWKANATGAQWLKVKLAASAQTFNCICIGNHNYFSNAGVAQWSSITIDSSLDDAAWTTRATLTGANTQEFVIPGQGTNLNPNVDFCVLLGTDITTDFYVRINFGGSTVAPQVGIFSVGYAYGFQNPSMNKMRSHFSWPFEEVPTPGGGRIREAQSTRPFWGFDMSVESLPFDNDLVASPPVSGLDHLLYTLGTTRLGARPFWYIPRDDSVAATGSRQSRAHWVYLNDKFSTVEKFTELYDFDLNIAEAV